MIGMCMCGDTNCPSCGPAQGCNPDLERVQEAMAELIHPALDEEQDGCDKLIVALGQFPRITDLLSALTREITHGGELTAEDIAAINKKLNEIKPCPKHGEWPDSEYGCIECYRESLVTEGDLDEGRY